MIGGRSATARRHMAVFLVAVAAGLAVCPETARGEPVAMVTDVSGKAVLEGAPGKGGVAILSEISADARVQLEGGARLTAVYVASGDEYIFTGPAQIRFRAGEPQVVSGAAPQKRSSPLAKAGKDVTIKLGGVAQAGFVMRGSRTTGRIRLLTLAGTKTLESAPEFRWQGASAGTRYHFKLADDRGNGIYETDVEGTTLRLPPSVRLNEGVGYTWELSAQLSDGRRYASSGDFALAPADLGAQVEALRPADGAAVAERVLFAAWLEQSGLRDEAKKYWKALVTERPEDPALQALGEDTAHPPRTLDDITALLDEYKPDPVRIERLKVVASADPPKTGDGDKLGEFYSRRAGAAAELGLVNQEIADLRRALELFRGDPDNAWAIGRRLFSTELFAGNFVNARQLREQMRTIRGSGKGRGKDLRDELGLAGIHLIGDDVAEAHGRLRSAEAILFKMSRKGRRTGPRWDVLVFDLEHARARVFDAEGKLVDAEIAYRKALDAAERVLTAEDSAVDKRGRSRRHRDLLFWRDRCESALAENLMAQGRLAEAEIVIRNVLKSSLSRVGRYSASTALSMVSFARILGEQGRYVDAARMAQAAIEAFEHVGVARESVSLVRARGALASALVARSRWQEAIAVFETIQSDLARDPRSFEKLGRGSLEWALALIKSGRPAAALPMLEGGLKRLGERLGASHYQVAEQRGFLAMALAETGRRQRAVSEYQEAIKVLLARGRAEGDEESASPARIRRLTLILEGYIKLLHDIRNEIGQRAGLDPAAEAFRVGDAARGQSTQRALTASAARAAARDPALADLIRKEQDANQLIAVLYTTLVRLLSAPPDQQLPQVAAQMRQRIQELEKEQRRLFSDLERRFPAYVNLINPRPATVNEARAALKEGEALLSLLTTEDRTYVWAVPKSGPLGFHAAALGDKAVAGMVAELRKTLDPGKVTLENFPEFDVAAAHRLYAELLKPVESAWKGARTLLVVANGALAQLPFSVLPTESVSLAADSGLKFERYKQVRWLIKEAALVQLPAVNTLVTLRGLPRGNPGRTAFAGFGDPQFGPQRALAVALDPTVLRMRSAALPRPEEGKPADWVPYSRLAPLPDTRDEILAIAGALKADPQRDVFLGAAANRHSVKRTDLAQRRILAFATHGLIPGDFPNLEQPALALSAPSGNAEEGLLTLEDILALKLDADWVVLSACNTAAGEGAGAEAISGLGRGFFYAGSRALLVTHWPVETRSARLLVTGLFERYAGNAALGRAQALQQASLAVMEGSAQDGGGKPLFSYAHPLFWAPYALVGDGGR